MIKIKYSKRFKKDYKKVLKYNPAIKNDLKKVVDFLLLDKDLPKNYKNHKLKGEFSTCFECYLRPDILLIYQKKNSELIILLLRIGSHSKLFG